MPSLTVERGIVKETVKNIKKEEVSLNGNNRMLKKRLFRLRNALNKILRSGHHSKPVRIPVAICAELGNKGFITINDIPKTLCRS